MADFAILAQHPEHPQLLIGIPLDAFDQSTATDHAFHLTHSYRVPGLFWSYHPQSTAGDYLVFYKYQGYTRCTAITASNLAQAQHFMAHLQSHGRVVTPDQPIA